MDSNTLINILIGVLIGISAAGLYLSLTHRIKMLEEANRRNIPYHSFEEIQNAKAVLNSELFASMCKIDLIQNCGNHLDNAIAPQKPSSVKRTTASDLHNERLGMK